MAKIRTEVEVPDGDYCAYGCFKPCPRLNNYEKCSLFIDGGEVHSVLQKGYSSEIEVVLKCQACKDATYRETENGEDKD